MQAASKITHRHPLTRRAFLAAGLCSGSLLTRLASAADPTPEELMTKETNAAIERGLAFLKSRQVANGSFGRPGYPINVAVVALAGIAFMSRGYTPGRGEYGTAVSLCLEYILGSTEASGFINTPTFPGQGPMYGHGFATMFLAEAYGMAADPRIRDRLVRAVKLILNTQNDEGGWRYFPVRDDADISVTICQIMALRAARNAGIYVPNDRIDRCIQYVKRCQNTDGGFMYTTLQPGISEFPRSAAGVVALYSAGIYQGDEIERGLKYLVDHAPHSNPGTSESYFYYGQYYAMQAMYQAGGTYWSNWYPPVRDLLLKRQVQQTGEWSDDICSEYGTAMACIALQMPNNFLPIFQR